MTGYARFPPSQDRHLERPATQNPGWRSGSVANPDLSGFLQYQRTHTSSQGAAILKQNPYCEDSHGANLVSGCLRGHSPQVQPASAAPGPRCGTSRSWSADATAGSSARRPRPITASCAKRQSQTGASSATNDGLTVPDSRFTMLTVRSSPLAVYERRLG